MGKTSTLFPNNQILTTIRGTVQEDVTENNPLSICRNGLFKSVTVEQATTDVSTGGAFTAVDQADNGTGKFVVAYRWSGNTRLKAYQINADKTISQIGSEQTLTNATYVKVEFHSGASGDDDFIVLTDNKIRVIRVSASAITLGSELTLDGTKANLAILTGGDIITCNAAMFANLQNSENSTADSATAATNQFAQTVSKSGTTLSSKTNLDVTVVTGEVNSGGNFDQYQGGVSLFANGTNLYMVFMVDPIGGTNDYKVRIARYTLSGTVLTRQNSGDYNTGVNGDLGGGSQNWDPIIAFGTSSALIAFQAGNVTNDPIIVSVLNTTTCALSSTTTIDRSGYDSNNLEFFLYWDSTISRFILAQEESGDVFKFKQITTGGSISSTFEDFTLQGPFSIEKRSGNLVLIYNDFSYFLRPFDSDLEIKRIVNVTGSTKIGLAAEDATSGNLCQVDLRGAVAGALTEGLSALTPGRNYYLGDVGLLDEDTKDSDDPFFGWAIDASRVVRSESAL